FVATGVLLWADQYAEDRVVLAAALADAELRGSVLGRANALYCRGCTWWLEGRPDLAAADLREALTIADGGWTQYQAAAQGLLMLNLIELGRQEQARAVL